MNSERIFSENRVPPGLANRHRHTAGITDNRPVTQQQRQMITAIRQGTSRLMPIQRTTRITYTTQEIKANRRGNRMTVGRKVQAVLDPRDPRQGSTPCVSHSHNILMTALPGFIKGHLLNHNLGGPGLWFNMFPISHRANHLHTYAVEEEVKELLIKANPMRRRMVYYNIEMIPRHPNAFVHDPTTSIHADFCTRSRGRLVTPLQSIDFESRRVLPGFLNVRLMNMRYGFTGAGQRGAGAPNHFSVNAVNSQVLEGGVPVGTINWNRAAAAISYP